MFRALPRTQATAICIVLALAYVPLIAQENAAPEIAGPELVVNGNFDSAGEGKSCPFAGWAGRSGQNGQYTFELAPGKSGKCAKIDGSKAGRGDIHSADGFPVKAGETVPLRFFARAENMKGGAFMTLEGEPNEDGWHKINIDATKEWKLYESRVVVPKGAKGAKDPAEPKIMLWFYHFGTGSLFLDDISLCVVKPDPVAAAREEFRRLREWAALPVDGKTQSALKSVAEKIDAALKDPKAESIAPLRRELYSALSLWHGGDGSFALGVASNLEKVFLDEPFAGEFAPALKISLAQNESEGAQVVVLSAGKELNKLSVELDTAIPELAVSINVVGYVDTSKGSRPYQSSKLGWWPDPLLPNTEFDVKTDEAQPLLVTAASTPKTKAGVYKANLLVKAAGQLKATLPLEIEVYSFALPTRGHLATMALGSSAAAVSKFFGGDPDEKVMERFALSACKHRMPPIKLINGWAWKTPSVPKTSDGKYDFAKLDHWLDLFSAQGVTRFPMATVPRFRKFGGGDYTEEFHKEFGAFVAAYFEHLKTKNLSDRAVVYNIDEASNDGKLREWEECKAIYKIVKQAAPALPVVQCLNEYKGVVALAGNADIWDLYFGQFEQAGGPERMKAGDQTMLAVCIWPHEHPNLFTEYPLLDARIMPWIAFRTGAKGFEYWDLFATWQFNDGNKDWFKHGARTAWKLENQPHGDGLLMYPGADGEPLSSLRLESLRDGIEDYEYLVLLAEKAKAQPAATALLKEATEQIATGITSFNHDPKKLLDLRARIAKLLSVP